MTEQSSNPYARPVAADAELLTPPPVVTPSVVTPEPTATEGSVVVRGVAVRYGSVVAVDDVDLVAPPGSLLALTGPSGAGKSSLLWAVAGAVPPAAGEVTVGETRIRDRDSAIRAGVALIPQGNGLAGVLTAHENVAFPLKVRGFSKSEIKEKIDRALDMVELPTFGDRGWDTSRKSLPSQWNHTADVCGWPSGRTVVIQIISSWRSRSSAWAAPATDGSSVTMRRL